MNKSVYEDMVTDHYYELEDDERKKVAMDVFGIPEIFEIRSYIKKVQKEIRDKMVELGYVHSFEEINNENRM